MMDSYIDGINSFLVIIIYGSLIMLSFLLASNALKVNKKANLIFGIFLFLWSTFWLEEIFEFTHFEIANEGAIIALRQLQFFTPLFFYYGTLYYTNPDYIFKKTDAWYLILPAVYFIGLIINVQSVGKGFLPILLNVLIIIHSIFFIILSYIKIKEHKKKINLFASHTEEIDLRWLEYIIVGLLAISIFIGAYNAIFASSDLNLFANLFSLIVVFFVGVNSVRQKEIFVLDASQRSQVIEANQIASDAKRKLLSTDDMESLKLKLTRKMESEELFLNPELSLLQLAEAVDITPHQLSYLINEGFQENFFMYVNKYRVEKVKAHLKDKNKKNLAILGIAFESGFNSKTSFYTTFKKITSMTPSEYLKKSS